MQNRTFKEPAGSVVTSVSQTEILIVEDSISQPAMHLQFNFC